MSSEVEKIIRVAEDCLSNAEYNLHGGWSKAAVNRAYYCMFYCVTALLHIQQISAKTHQGAHLKFRELYIKTGLMPMETAESLRAVFEMRQSCDYDFEFDPTGEDAKGAIDMARDFLEATKNHLGIP